MRAGRVADKSTKKPPHDKIKPAEIGRRPALRPAGRLTGKKTMPQWTGSYAENPYFYLCKLIFTNLIALCHVYATRFYSWLQPSA